jgi:SEC-C motif domain protein
MADGPCPCCSGKDFGECCRNYLDRKAQPETAETLMRSRYSAYVRQDIAYLKETLWPRYQDRFDAPGTAKWAAENHWTGLTVLETDKGEPEDRDGTVLFEAKFLSGGKLQTHQELSLFRKKKGQWFYVEAVSQ